MNNRKLALTILSVLIIILVAFAVLYYLNYKSTNENLDTNLENNNVLNGNVDYTNTGVSEDTTDTNTGEIIEESSVQALDELIYINNYDELQSYLNSDDSIFLVLGKTGCVHCENYKPVLNSISSKYGIKIVYIDLANLSEEEKSRIMNSDIKIPAKCSQTNTETSLSNGFGTPLSLFIKNKESFDCIRGYVDEDSLISTLKNLNLIN